MKSKLAIAITAATLATTLTACGPGFDAPTRLIQQVTDGVDATVETGDSLIYLRNIYVTLNAAGDASLVGTIINQKENKDALLALAIDRQQIKIPALPALQNQPIIFGGPSANATADLPASGLIAGHHTQVSFFFGIGGTVTVDALVVNA